VHPTTGRGRQSSGTRSPELAATAAAPIPHADRRTGRFLAPAASLQCVQRHDNALWFPIAAMLSNCGRADRDRTWNDPPGEVFIDWLQALDCFRIGKKDRL